MNADEHERIAMSYRAHNELAERCQNAASASRRLTLGERVGNAAGYATLVITAICVLIVLVAR